MEIYAQVIDNLVNLIGGTEVGLPLPQDFLDINPNILNINITDLEYKPEIGYIYDPEKNIFISGQEWFDSQIQIIQSPPLTLQEIETASAIEKQADTLINDMEIKKQNEEIINKLNKLLGIEEEVEIVPIKKTIRSAEIILPTEIQINYFNMIQNFYNRNVMDENSVAKFVKIGNLTPEQYRMITGNEYILQ